MIEAVRKELSEHAGAILGTEAAPRLSIVQLGGTGKQGGRVHFGAIDKRGEAVVFARAMRNPGHSQKLRDELTLLEALAEHPSLRDLVPAPRGIVTIAGQELLIESAAPGPLMSEEIRFGLTAKDRVGHHLTVANELLIALAQATRASLDETTFTQENLEPLRACWKESGGDPAKLETVVDHLLTALDGNFTSVLVHGDFNPNNLVLRNASSCCALDWETARPNGLPLVDLFYFISRYADLGGLSLQFKKAARVSGFYRSNNAATRAARNAVELYCDRLGLSHDVITPLFQLHFLQKAWLKWQQTGMEGNKTRLWLGLFEAHVDEARPPLR